MKENYQTDLFDYDYATYVLNCKLLSSNPYQSYFQEVYPAKIDEHELTADMLEVLSTYTDSRTNQCYRRTNLNLLSGNFDQIDWIYVNKLRSLIRNLNQHDIKPIYYRGLTLSDTEIQYYLDRRKECYYTNSFTSFTTDRLLVYSGNSLLILKTENASDKAKTNIANIWKWSVFKEEREALVAVGSKLRVLAVHYFGCKWEIEVELVD